MPNSPKQALLFTLLMCPIMVAGMSLYNMIAIHGFTWEALRMAIYGFPLALLVAFALDFFVVAQPAKALAAKIIRPSWPNWAKIVTVSTTMIVFMVVLMSGFGAVMAVGYTREVWAQWAANIPFNFIAALPLQLIIAGPIVRFVFGRVLTWRRTRVVHLNQ
ncbi:DUF2798 domain-containing protein [Corynebacterium pelargi]|uniref:Uncharacterized protein n=1 Tax=Corynebacterium pelargi TaxID=1471400 RepID=A0A410WA14_9CORY|nr:DUF2798 domain-containing protein [Corynebacterium pelargi]QAU52790.1 hypothetical protein CPELA_07650 [Corynebacterium pelargi]GGG78796.1 DUF2798 domain-containing protein [Corynebacterium pelargi]